MAFQPKVIKNVTVPLLKLKKGTPYYVRFVSELYKGKEIPGPVDATTGQPVAKNAPMMARVNNLEDETGELFEIIVPTVAYKELSENYPSVIGKCFALTISSAGDGKRYSLATIAEIEDPNPAPAAASGDEQPAGGKNAKK